MSNHLSTGDFFECPNCHGKGGFHNLPCSGGLPYGWQGPSQYAPNPPRDPKDGCREAVPLTERDVQKIVVDVLERLALRLNEPQEFTYRAIIAAVRKELNLP